jgi:hypothetical protein
MLTPAFANLAEDVGDIRDLPAVDGFGSARAATAGFYHGVGVKALRWTKSV